MMDESLNPIQHHTRSYYKNAKMKGAYYEDYFEDHLKKYFSDVGKVEREPHKKWLKFPVICATPDFRLEIQNQGRKEVVLIEIKHTCNVGEFSRLKNKN